MKKILLIFLILFSSSLPKKIIAQNNNDGAALAGAAIGAAIGVMIAIEQMKEQAELEATQYMIANYPELDKFSLETLDFDGKKISDMSSTSVISYTVTEFDLIDNEPVLGKRMILFGFTSYGWVNNNVFKSLSNVSSLSFAALAKRLSPCSSGFVSRVVSSEL